MGFLGLWIGFAVPLVSLWFAFVLEQAPTLVTGFLDLIGFAFSTWLDEKGSIRVTFGFLLLWASFWCVIV